MGGSLYDANRKALDKNGPMVLRPHPWAHLLRSRNKWDPNDLWLTVADELDALVDLAVKLSQEIVALDETLQKHGGHTDDCHWILPNRCECGWSNIVRARGYGLEKLKENAE